MRLPRIGLQVVLTVLAIWARAETVYIEKDGAVVGVLPESAGRVVSLRFQGGPNLLDEPLPKLPVRPRPPLDYRWSQDKGQIIWSGPQSAWWRNQDLLPEKRDRGDKWPPDPDWTRAVFLVVSKTRSKIVLQSPVSRISGLQLTKTIECLPGGTVRVQARVLNTGSRAVSRNLWFVFRAPFSAREYVPVRSREDVQLYRPSGGRIVSGLHSLTVSPPWMKTVNDNKARINPAAPWIACGYPEGFLIFRFAAVPRSSVPEEHAPVEIYRKLTKSGESLLEVETHSALRYVPPGGTMEAWETWEFLPVPKRLRESARRRLLMEHIAGE